MNTTTTHTPEDFTAALDRFLEAAQRKVDIRFADGGSQVGKLTKEEGPKFVRIVIASGCKDGDPLKWSKSVYCFVDRELGKVWKPASYKAAERKNPRSCIFDEDNGAKGVDGYGAVRLR